MWACALLCACRVVQNLTSLPVDIVGLLIRRTTETWNSSDYWDVESLTISDYWHVGLLHHRTSATPYQAIFLGLLRCRIIDIVRLLTLFDYWHVGLLQRRTIATPYKAIFVGRLRRRTTDIVGLLPHHFRLFCWTIKTSNHWHLSDYWHVGLLQRRTFATPYQAIFVGLLRRRTIDICRTFDMSDWCNVGLVPHHIRLFLSAYWEVGLLTLLTTGM